MAPPINPLARFGRPCFLSKNQIERRFSLKSSLFRPFELPLSGGVNDAYCVLCDVQKASDSTAVTFSRSFTSM